MGENGGGYRCNHPLLISSEYSSDCRSRTASGHTGMSYAEFLAIFLVPPLAVALVLTPSAGKRAWLSLAGISLLALLYTTPWDNLLIDRGVWSYRPDRITGLVIGHVPLEECAFYVLQVLFTGLLTLTILRRSGR